MLSSHCILFCQFPLFLRVVQYSYYAKPPCYVVDYVTSLNRFCYLEVLKDLEGSLFCGEHRMYVALSACLLLITQGLSSDNIRISEKTCVP